MTGRAEPEQAGPAQGFALVLVLWVVIIMAVIASALLEEVRGQRRSAATDLEYTKLVAAADGGINRAILSFVDPADPLRFRIDGTPQAVDAADTSIAVRVYSEAGKINLNTVGPALLAHFFTMHGASATDAESTAAHIVAWRSPVVADTTDLEATDYMGAHRPYLPRHAPFRTVGELRLVLGMTDDLQAAIAPVLCVYSNAPSVDISVADDAVLQFLASDGNRFAAGQLAARAQGNAAGVDRRPAVGEALDIYAESTGASVAVERVAVIRLSATVPAGYQVLSWR